VHAPILTLDRGNTTLDAMLHRVDGETRRIRLAPDDSAGLSAFLAGERPRRCAAVSVVPDGLQDVLALLGVQSVPVAVVGRDLQCPLRIDYDTPQTLGADRWLGALAAHRQFGAAITVDCGSATTVNLVERDGTFRGGAIAPGVRALCSGMAQVTPHLPLADVTKATAMPPRSSATAVHTGVALAYCGAIERLVADLQLAARSATTIVVTGGHADDYRRHGQLACIYVPDLVHQGLRHLVDAACAS
jgi:type III pantothenate kinase